MQVTVSQRRRLGTFRVGETVAHQIPTGFWYVWQPEIDSLQDEFSEIWNGEGGTYAACDRVYFAFMNANNASYPRYWDQTVESPYPPAEFDWPGSDQTSREDTWRNANAWVGRAASEPTGYGNVDCALSKLRDMNNPSTNARAMRAVISRFLYGLVRNAG